MHKTIWDEEYEDDEVEKDLMSLDPETGVNSWERERLLAHHLW